MELKRHIIEYFNHYMAEHNCTYTIENLDNIDWKYVCLHTTLTEDFLEKLYPYMNFRLYCQYSDNVLWEKIEDIYDVEFLLLNRNTTASNKADFIQYFDTESIDILTQEIIQYRLVNDSNIDIHLINYLIDELPINKDMLRSEYPITEKIIDYL